MKENSYDNNMNELDEEKVNYQELFFKYIIHWPWFVASVLACLIGAWVYLHFQTPVYQVSASIMIKDDKKGGGNTTDLESLGLGGMITSTQSIDNEIEVLRSKTILKEVVNNLELYITYYDEDEFPKKELYKTSPVIVNLTTQEADKLPGIALIDMKLAPEGGLDVNLKVGLSEYAKHFDRLPAVLPTDAGTFGRAGCSTEYQRCSQPAVCSGKRISVVIKYRTHLKNNFCSGYFAYEYEYATRTGLYQ